METKKCPHCGIEKNITEFWKEKKKKDGLQIYCKNCCNEITKNYYKEYKKTEAYRKVNRRYKEKHKNERKEYTYKEKIYKSKEQVKLSKYKKGAKERNIEFSLTDEQFHSLWQQSCSYCGGEIETIGIDRVDSSIGYIIDNCVPCCKICNWMKLSKTKQEFLEHCYKITKHQKQK